MAQAVPKMLAIDQSTSATKAIVFDAHGTLHAKASRDHRQIYPEPGWVEHDAEVIWTNTLAVAREIAEKHPKLAAELKWVSVTNQRETIVVFERETGRPLYHAIVWQCHRGDVCCSRLKAAGHDDAVREKTGLRIDTYFSASKLNWMVENLPELAAKLRDGSALIGTIDAYLIYRLTGGKVFATDSTNASRTLLYNIRTRLWDPWLCELFDVPPEALPEVRDSDAQFGATDFEGAFKRELPICGVMGDSQASLFALRCFQPGDAKMTIGTGSSSLLNIGPEMKLSEGGAVTALGWVVQGQATYCFEGIINYAAATVEWLKNQLQLIETADECESLATSVADNGGVYLVPAFTGLSAPYWHAEARAAIIGMSAHATKAHVVRAALECIAYQIRDVLEMMRGDADVELTHILADGGATRNQFLMQFIADIVRMKVHVSDVAESSPLGAALCGAIGQDVFKFPDEVASATGSDRVIYAPQMDAATSARLYQGWQQAVNRVL